MGGSAKNKDERVRRSYAFLLKHEKDGSVFSLSDLVAATGWKPGTAKTYPNKKWAGIVTKEGATYRVHGVSKYSEAEYVRLMSQKDTVSADPKRPVLAPDVEALVRKARESALLALHVYNSPATIFRTEGFSVLMVIAWTSLFHALFEKQGKPYFYLEPDGVTPKIVDGDRKAWELSTCMNEFWGGADHATRRNLDFFIRLRNRVEHRYVPAIDPHVAGECQALLLNFDEMLIDHFGEYFALRDSLAVPLHTASVRTAAHVDALRKLQARHFEEVQEFVDAYRRDLPTALYADPKFSFRVYLVPKVGNHSSSSDVAMEFVKHDPERPDEMAALQKAITLVREKHVSVANAGLLSAKKVSQEVASRIARPFTVHHHTLAWKKYGVRKPGFDPAGCDAKYCVPDARHKDYGYTSAWVDLLTSKLSVEAEYQALLAWEPEPSGTKQTA